MTALTVDRLFDTGVLQLAGAHYAKRMAGHEPPLVQVAAALAVEATQQAHATLDLDRIADNFFARDPEHAGEVDAVVWPSADEWKRALTGSSLVEVVDALEPAEPPESRPRRPLTLRGNLLYLSRFDLDESDIANRLRSRIDHGPASKSTPRDLSHLFPPNERDPAHGAHTAAETIIANAFTILTGGPGTGKTYTIARAVAAIWEQQPGATVALAAPTGKAASRMTEAMTAAADEVSGDVSDRLRGLSATTLHRLLGLYPGRAPRRGTDNQLTEDVIVIDEVSMISLPLMADLLRAVPPEASLVLVGDPHQLSSVEAGSVLRDLVEHESPTRRHVVELTVNHRSVPELEMLFTAVNEGRADDVVDLLRSPNDITQWHEVSHHAGTTELERQTAQVFGELIAPAARLAVDHDAADWRPSLLTDLMVLCATRQGPLGVEQWERRIESVLLRRGARHRRWYQGRPVMITRNDPLTGLFNGDTGWFDGEKVEFDDGRRFLPSQLSDIETWWAMTIHKSQGSEFRHAVVSLDHHRQLNTRELLYTAITRAQERLTIVASERSLREAIANQSIRASGLRSRLGPRRIADAPPSATFDDGQQTLPGF